MLRIMPNLIITKEQIDEGLKTLERTIEDVARSSTCPGSSSPSLPSSPPVLDGP